ncbi:hypothetical protein E1B28_004911 [Marasmius oreades]|uniref:Microbial-type PARG catalytic domain-containing protein n=1 Tax=Marasmius oreades TaxID=181124 RepID=A0A9P8ADG4_9AGAR|nr:uncharacterized protein E1B28_004911 [Marasmius oreades]KAG7097574.1 hypothetical protein E1B28_004911 [Marasmius oreades]
MTPDLAKRYEISQDTISRSEAITAQYCNQGATLDSTFIDSQLPALDPASCPNHPPSPVEVVNSDSFTAARNIIKRFPEAINGKTAVLNLASDQLPGGRWDRTLSKTQEEALCYSSTLFKTLKPRYYPWPNTGPGSVAGVFSPGIAVFKDDLDHGCVDLPEEDRCVVGVITVAAPRGPELTNDRKRFAREDQLSDLRGKIRLIYRMAARNGREYVVLGAIGCGAYGCPPQQVAKEMMSILLEKEFNGWFRNVTFAVYSHPDNGYGNYDVFKTAFKDVDV